MGIDSHKYHEQKENLNDSGREKKRVDEELLSTKELMLLRWIALQRKAELFIMNELDNERMTLNQKLFENI